MPTNLQDDIGRRKRDHLDLCLNEEVQFRERGTLLDQVHLVHEALPELDAREVDLTVELLGKTLRLPLYISGMTGGTPDAERINRDLAAVAEEEGIAFGMGSQRPLLENPALLNTYAVRDVAPRTLLFGNLGLVQAAATPTPRIRELVDATGVDALCLHLNPAQEMMQEGGDRDFRGGIETLKRLRGELGLPLIVKETGCGLSESAARKIRSTGVTVADVAGAGGTSWVGVETRRAANDRKSLGTDMWDWGIPTAASLLLARRVEGLTLLASGGIRSGNDVSAALALGASAVGMAFPYLRAHAADGREGVRAIIRRLGEQLRMTLTLTGSRNLNELRQKRRVLTGELTAWAALPPATKE